MIGALLAGLAYISPLLLLAAFCWLLVQLVAYIASGAEEREDARDRNREPVYWRPRR